jgi:hypothetical protein
MTQAERHLLAIGKLTDRVIELEAERDKLRAALRELAGPNAHVVTVWPIETPHQIRSIMRRHDIDPEGLG